ncbi:MAG: class I SAM-dependent methyltransferase [Gammaproteobacteria bacterium]|nr:class I SAM-dependent methyltransferase [Gammaproteobacteria bacterium]
METFTDSYPTDAFEKLFEIENNHFWFQSRNKLICAMLKRYFSAANNFLEIGCGTGCVLSFLSNQFTNIHFTGGDLHIEGLDFARQRTQDVELVQMDALKIDFENKFDVVGAFDILEHIEQDELVLTQIYQALKPKGGLILTVPQHPFMWSGSDDYAHHVRRYTAKDLKQKLTAAGFQITKMTSFMTLLFPIMYLSRLRYKLNLSKGNVPVEFEIPNLLNTGFKFIQNVERILISSGIKFPFGGSILAVATKS